MPIKVERRGYLWVVTDGRETYGRHNTEREAVQQLRAIYASENREKEKKGKG